MIEKRLEQQQTTANDKDNAKNVLESNHTTNLASKTSFKALPKALVNETLKPDVKQVLDQKQEDDKKQAIVMKNNNKTSPSKANTNVTNESDDDDSVFINENKPKKGNKATTKTSNLNVLPASLNASSVTLNSLNVSSSNTKAVAPAAAQIHNSRDLNVKSETVVSLRVNFSRKII
ncbi:CLUMA_CG004110, isoform A [Clunio marinus]|uniref:CLUMA_CG004110, isoform A n=1 Tax=Clunio marinus TaxID=568069 RepID=A0A1J1HS13_9DIPT|nr:CLUMA_CG004110, isoform A [Clunio marinus]